MHSAQMHLQCSLSQSSLHRFQAPKSITTFRNVYCLQKAAWHNEMSHCQIVNSYLCIQIQFERKFSNIICSYKYKSQIEKFLIPQGSHDFLIMRRKQSLLENSINDQTPFKNQIPILWKSVHRKI